MSPYRHAGAKAEGDPIERERFLMTSAEAITLKAASRRTRLSVDTIRRLVRRHGIGRQMTARSPIEVSYPALVMLRHGDVDAVELLRDGKRDHPVVRKYMALIESE